MFMYIMEYFIKLYIGHKHISICGASLQNPQNVALIEMAVILYYNLINKYLTNSIIY